MKTRRGGVERHTEQASRQAMEDSVAPSHTEDGDGQPSRAVLPSRVIPALCDNRRLHFESLWTRLAKFRKDQG